MKRPAWADIRYHGSRWAWVAGLAVLAYLAFPSSATDLAPLLEPGAKAGRDVIAPFDFVVNKTDEELAREAEELAASAKPIYQFQQRVYDSTTAALRALFQALEDSSGQGPQGAIRVARRAGVILTLTEAGYVQKGGKRHNLERALTDLFAQTLAQGVTGPGVLRAESSAQLIVRHGATELPVARDQVPSYNDYLLRSRAVHPDPGSSVGDVVYLKLVRRFFRPTLVLDEAETRRRRSELMGSVDPSKYVVRQGERLASAGEIISAAAHEKLQALHTELVRRGAATSTSFGGVVGPMLRDAMILSVFWVLMLFYRRETYRDQRQVALVALLFAATLLGAAGVAHTRPDRPELIPLPFQAMMLTVLFNGRVSMIGAMIVSAVIGTQPVFHDTPALFQCVMGGVTAALSVRSLRRRSHLYTAVLIVGAGYLAGAFSLGLAGSWRIGEIGSTSLFGIANGLVSGALTILLLPLAESFTRVTTDLTLLELSDPSRPLLRRLSLEAPGTYAHSVAMANLVESACNRIGANGLLGRVGCYYHDIGKLGNPLYFVENQTRGGNPHDKIPPAQSVEIIKRHVTDGLQLAADAGMPEVVAAFIPEHHGTSEITYFYDRAKKQGDPNARREDYRYPGPKPRSVETAVAMLADSVEAALRVLDDLTPQKIEEAINHIIRTKLSTGQLDEAPLTLRQIDEVKAEFVRVLSGMYHNRIDYPESSGGISKAWQPTPQASGL
jgi:cyclic-di-AMP phosphodiesterase PgpH